MPIDLGEIKNEVTSPHKEESPSKEEAVQEELDLLKELDVNWFRFLNPRYLDLVGDYCGQELFLIDGDALIQQVLNDPLLNLGNARDDFSFQIVHAVHTLEKLILKFLKRDCVFEIVFFEDLHDIVAVEGLKGKTDGQQERAIWSRRLASALLRKHCCSIAAAPDTSSFPLVVETFSGLEAEEWREYIYHKKPFFILTSDGGSQPSLLRRACFARFCEEVEGMGVCLFEGLEFKDAKIFAFVHDSRIGSLRAYEQAKKAYATAVRSPSIHAFPMFEQVVQKERFLETVAATFLSLETPASSRKSLPLLRVWIAHSLLLKDLPLDARVLPWTRKLPKKLVQFLHASFLPSLYRAIHTVVTFCELKSEDALAMDGRVFVELIHSILEGGDDVVRMSCWEEVETLMVSFTSQAQLSKVFNPGPPSHHLNGFHPDDADASNLELVPFSHPIIDSLLTPVHLSLPSADEPDPAPFFNFSTVTKEDKHWHNSKPLVPHLHRGPPEKRDSFISADRKRWLEKKRLQRDQRFKAALHRQAESLTGQAGMIKTVIVPDKKGKEKVGKHDTSKEKKVGMNSEAGQGGYKGKHGKKAKGVVLSHADKIRAENLQKKQQKSNDETHTWWKSQLEALTPLDIELQLQRVDALSKNKRTQETSWLRIELGLYRIHLLISRWHATHKRISNTTEDDYRVQILRHVLDILKQKSSLCPSYLRPIRKVLEAMGLESLLMAREATISTEAEDRQLSFKFLKLPQPFLHITDEDPWVFQLRIFGEYMDRSVGGQPDPRVTFQPDEWQREVLDRIDRHESMLVCAPTSAGKTFIGYSAMQQVLQESDEGLIVYLAPTKALVNQVAAETYARFSKDFAGTGKTLWAIHTRDYRINSPQNCQILITVPQILLIMLLSPALAKRWAPRIRWVIFDEIHNIGNEQDGAVWQQLLLLVTCPVIALSATVGSPERFSNWLGQVQRSHGHPYSLIMHKQRYNALRKFLYAPSQLVETFKGFQGKSAHGSSSFTRIHPLSALNANSQSLPEDLALEPSDCLTLFQELDRTCPGGYENLRPAQFFKGRTELRIVDVLEYEKSLKAELGRLMSKERGVFITIIARLHKSVDDAACRNDQNEELKGNLGESLFTLVVDLQKDQSLPAIIFNFDRSICEQAGQIIYEELVEAEDEWKDSAEEWRLKMETYKIWLKTRREKEKRAEREAKNSKVDEEQFIEPESDPYTNFDPTAPLPQFNLANLKGKFSMNEVDEMIKEIEYIGMKPWFGQALKRGIGVHHAGMAYRYRVIVETLFRAGYLQVVISTGTLAMGINMPCKSVVFLGDSVYLTSLNYRQCSGRSGRRGFDLIGKVIFHGIPVDRVRRLMASRLPSLNGSFPLTTTLVLQLLSLLYGSDNAEHSEKAVRNFFNVERMSVASEEGKLEML
ncbi:P-loop containing nucleoside triphosphate hydrolase protein, partial [Atractiella rhizophila]